MIKEYNGEVIDDGFILLFFYASYSSNCNTSLANLDYLAHSFTDMDIIKINITKYINLKTKYKIKVIPTYLLLNKNNIISKCEGAQNRIALTGWVNQYYFLLKK